MLKRHSSYLMASAGGAGGEGLKFFVGLATRSSTMLQGVYGQYKLDLVYFYLERGGGGGHRVGEWAWEEWEVNVLGAHCTKFPNKHIMLGKKEKWPGRGKMAKWLTALVNELMT